MALPPTTADIHYSRTTQAAAPFVEQTIVAFHKSDMVEVALSRIVPELQKRFVVSS